MADYPISNVPRRVQYVNSGVGPYAFAFEVLVQTDIAVYRGNTKLTLTTDYTVTINANGTGSITLVTAGTGNITIVGARAIQRSSDYTTGGDLFANTLNTDLDSQTIFSQQLAETSNRTITAPITDSSTLDMQLPVSTVRANKVFAFDADGRPQASVNTLAAIDAAVDTIESLAGAPSGSSAGISYIASGSGATATTVQAKLRQTVSVKDFGAVGNGTTDDTAAIQAAINSGAKRVYIPAGTYRVTTTIDVISRDLVIYGDGINGTIIMADLSLLIPLQIGGDTITETSFFVTLQDFTVSRAAGTPPTNSVGISWWNYNYGTEINVRSTRHYYCRKLTSAIFPTTGFITIGYKAFTTYADNATRAYTLIEHTAEAHFDMVEMGLNGGEAYSPLYCIEITGEANDVIVANSNLIPRGPSSVSITSMVGFIDFINTSGLFNFNNCNIENALHGFVSNSGTPLINELAVLGGRYAVSGDAVVFNAATEVRASQFTGMKTASAFKLTKPIWTTVNGCLFNSVVLVGGTGANLTFNDNTVLGATTISGAWDQLTLMSNQFNFAPTFTATGTYTRIDNGAFDWNSGDFTIDTNGNTDIVGDLNVGLAPLAQSGFSVVKNTNTYVTHAVHNKYTAGTPSFDTDQILMDASAGNYPMSRYYVAASGSPVNQFSFYGNGNGKCAGAWTGGGADYAEFFEWEDGNASNEDRRGMSVSLVNDKIKIAEPGDTVIGVISGNPSIVGNSAWNHWQGRFLRDEFGTIKVDEDGKWISNSEYDPEVEYVPREQRKEWVMVGLIGKISVRKGQQTNTNWIKLRDVSTNVEEWLIK